MSTRFSKESAMDYDRLVSLLNDLIETCKDGEYGFDTCAKHASSPEIRQLFAQRAADCRTGARELQALVKSENAAPDTSGSALGAMHRGWVAVLGTVSGNSDKRMLEEAERGEDSAVASYRKALRENDLPADVRAVLERQMAGAQRNHDQVKALRDSVKATS
jgi:uncharacterized protein (TIGR02284 family)